MDRRVAGGRCSSSGFAPAACSSGAAVPCWASRASRRWAGSTSGWPSAAARRTVVWRGNEWVPQPALSKDPAFRGIGAEEIDPLLRTVYKVLLTRGLVGTVVHSAPRSRCCRAGRNGRGPGGSWTASRSLARPVAAAASRPGPRRGKSRGATYVNAGDRSRRPCSASVKRLDRVRGPASVATAPGKYAQSAGNL